MYVQHLKDYVFRIPMVHISYFLKLEHLQWSAARLAPVPAFPWWFSPTLKCCYPWIWQSSCCSGDICPFCYIYPEVARSSLVKSKNIDVCRYEAFLSKEILLSDLKCKETSFKTLKKVTVNCPKMWKII